MVCALTVVFLLFGPYLSQFLRVGSHLTDVLKGRNAFWFQWQPDDPLALLGTMVLLAGIGVALRELLRWRARTGSRVWRSALRCCDHAFVLGVGGGLLANLWFHTQRPVGYRISQFGMEMHTAWVLLFAVAGYSIASAKSPLVLRCRQFCLMMSPAMGIVAWQLLHLPVLPAHHDTLLLPANTTLTRTVADHPQPQPPVLLFIFDEWSYPRTYDQRQLRPTFANLTELSRQSMVFHQAHSPGRGTIASIPGICRGTTDASELDGLIPGFTHAGKFRPATEYPSIFTQSGCAQYRKIMVQWGFAVSLWLGDELDAVRSYSCYPRGGRFAESAAQHVYNAVFYWTDPWSIFLYEKIKPRMTDPHTLRMYAQVHQDVSDIVQGPLEGVFAIVHYPTPHPPYLVNADGSYRGYSPDNSLRANEEGYQRNLARLDYQVGEIISGLKAAGTFDDCLLILTSDHTWRQDPQLPDVSDETITHVPLIVKLPGQTQPTQIDSDFRTFRLGQLIARCLQSAGRPPLMADLLDVHANTPLATVQTPQAQK